MKDVGFIIVIFVCRRWNHWRYRLGVSEGAEDSLQLAEDDLQRLDDVRMH